MRRPGLVLLMVLGIALLASPGASADVSGTFTIGSLTMNVGEEGAVELRALDVGPPGLGAWTFDVVREPDIISTVACDGGEVGVCGPSFSADSDRVTGTSDEGLEGTVTLAHFTFRCEHEGASSLTVSVILLVDATIGDPDLPDPDSVEVQPGSVTCEAEAEPTEGFPTALPTATIALPPTGSAAEAPDRAWFAAALAALGAFALVSGAALARRRRA